MLESLPLNAKQRPPVNLAIIASLFFILLLLLLLLLVVVVVCI